MREQIEARIEQEVKGKVRRRNIQQVDVVEQERVWCVVSSSGSLTLEGLLPHIGCGCPIRLNVPLNAL